MGLSESARKRAWRMYYDGYEMQEIADALGVTIATLESAMGLRW